MMRSGGVVENNLYLQNYNALLFGLGIEPEPAGVTGAIRRNVVLDGRDYGDGTGNPLPGGLCLDMGNVTSAVVTDNIFAHNTSGSGPRAIQLHDAHQYNSYRVVENTTFTNNIVYDWGGTIIDIQTDVGGRFQQPVNLRLVGNSFQGPRDGSAIIRHAVAASVPGVTSGENKFHSTAPASAWFWVGNQSRSLHQWKELVGDSSSMAREVAYLDPRRTIATYGTSIGAPATLAAFLAEARAQSKANWRPAYTAAAVNDYIRAGFGM